MTCAGCAERAKSELPRDARGTFLRGLLFGSGGALAGLILYATFAIVTGWIIGFVSLAVGYIVGKAMMRGSRGVGGRRYQIAAAALTYAAVSVAAIPVAMSQWNKQNLSAPTEQTQPAKSTPAENEEKTGEEAATAPAEPGDQRSMGLGAALGILLLLGLASPFLELQDPVNGLIGLVILFVGIQIAWKLTAGTTTEILGPFRLGAAGEEPAG
jgi:hypothetical protein